MVDPAEYNRPITLYHDIVGNAYHRSGARDLVDGWVGRFNLWRTDPWQAAWQSTGPGFVGNLGKSLYGTYDNWDQIPDYKKQDMAVQTAAGFLTGQVGNQMLLRGATAPKEAVARAAEQAAIRQRVLANIEASKASRLSSNFDVHLARTSQAGAPYGGVDAWSKTVIPKGSLVYGGSPGQPAFYTDLATIKASKLSAESLFKSLQVAPHPVRGYRPQIQAYRVLDDIEVPAGPVLANPQFGSGGGNQFFIQQYLKQLQPVRRFDLSR